MQTNTTPTCRCNNCPGASCTCGCQSLATQLAAAAAPAASTGCACGPNCACQPACRCI